jgi:hypothetical protein
MRSTSLKLSLILILCLFYSCKNKRQTPVSFYYWKQTFSLSSAQKKMMHSCGSKLLFIKFFDVIIDENQQVKPISKIDFQEPVKIDVVPCVFVQNEVFKHTDDVTSLAKKISKLILEIIAHQRLNVKEVQLDCDWTKGTRGAYFAFLESLKSELRNIDLVCTIRLHQIKYQESSGIPPVNKGLLMCYNMDDIDDITTPNSIVSSKVFKQYMNENISYPLKLDLALSIYQWGLVFRLGKLSVISNDLSLNELKSSYIKKIGGNTFIVNENTTLNETNLCKGDLIRHEASTSKELFQLIAILKQTNLKFEQLIYYHISQENLNSYHAATLSKINRLIP